MRNEPMTHHGTSATSEPLRSRDVELAGAMLMHRIGGVVRSADELEAYLVTVVRAVQHEIAACDDAGITLADVASPPRTVSTAEPTPEEEGGAAYGSVLAMPLSSAGETLGSLDLYARRTAAFDEVDTAVVRMAAECCADTIAAAQEILSARTLAAQLEQAMGSRVVIEQAKGILIGMQGTTAHEAFEILRKESQARNIRVRDLAEHIVTTAQGAFAAGKGRG